MEPVIHVNRVSKWFGRQVALDKVSFEVPPGVVFALLGENGAGKTTAIKIMLGLAEPDSGRTTVLGFDSGSQGLKIRQSVGYVAERPAMYDWMTVDEIGWFTAGFYWDGFLVRYREFVTAFQLPRDKQLKKLSKGMRAKVALALSMAHDPALLILDEPTSGLDPLVRREFLESMVDRAASGKTVLLASHQIHEVERVADMVGILRDGQLCLVEPLDRLRAAVREVTVTFSDTRPADLELPGEVLRERRHARQWQILVRDASDEALAALGSHAEVTALDTRTPNLEEILVAYLTCEQKTDEQSPQEGSPT